MKTEYKPLSLYLHIPFCVRKCFYCDFLSAPTEEAKQERYLNSLRTELEREAKNYEDYQVETVFFGGGTPSLVSPERLLTLLAAIRANYRVAQNPEITIEVNPGTADREKLAAYRQMGINRLSIGLQSAIDKELALLGRIHKAEDFFRVYEDAVKTGFNNINVDLMSAIPSQTESSYRETLQRVLSLKPRPAHISAYSLIIEEGTAFYENTPELPDEETDRRLYKITNDILKENGYHRYEISNYAREGYECRHNRVYWTRGDYAGFGIGAASLVANVRFHNCRDWERYMEAWEAEAAGEGQSGNGVKEEIQQLSKEEQIEEFMFLGLRLTEGVDLRQFRAVFGIEAEALYPGLTDRLESQGLLCCERNASGEKERIHLSELGLDVSNRVMAEFLLQ